MLFLGRRWNKWAAIVDVNGFSGHAGHNYLLRAFQPLFSQTCIELVHGDLPQVEALALALLEHGFVHVDTPSPGRTVLIDTENERCPELRLAFSSLWRSVLPCAAVTANSLDVTTLA